MKPSCFKRMLAVFMAVIMICTLLPGTALAASTAGTVHVTIENTTFTTSDAPWTGTLLDAEVALTGEMSMMSAVTTALNNADCECTSNGDYISGINGLSQKQNGDLSGWMGTLNDWFVNTGFSNYKESDHTLCDGDVIRVMYTSTGMGTDIGSGSYGNTDTALSALSVTGGTLEPSFAPAVTEYTVTVPSGTTEVKVNATAKFKDHQVYLSVGEAAYRRTAAIPVADGTTITVQCGESSIATTYTLKVQTAGGSTGEAGHTDWTSLTSFTEGETYYIATADDLAALATLVNSGNSGAGCFFVLTADIDLSTKCGAELGSWTPIGNSEESPFKGTFDGKDYTIKELYINSSDHAALFAYTDSAVLKNIVLYGEIKTVTNKHAAGLVYKATNTIIQYCTNHVNVLSGRWVSGIAVTCSGTCTITNCTNNGIITSTATNGQAAGILAATSASSDTLNVTNCENNGEITGIVAAGITGSQVKSGNVEKCTNTGAITSTKSGATGISDSSVNVRDCTNTGTITCVKAAAGIIGIAKKGCEITGCVNKGEIITTSAANGYTAGIVGKMKGTMSKCVNLGSIKGSYYVGGLAGVISGDSNISDSYNRGSIAEGIGISGSVGGLIGSADSNLTMICCYNTGDINTPNLPNVGGLVGNFSKKGTVVITDCYHSGTITGNDAVGGLIGKINHASASLTLQNCYSSASTVTATDGTAGMAFGSVTAASALNTSNLFVRQIIGLKTVHSDTSGMDINAVIPLTHAQMTDASFVTHLGTAFAKFSTDIYSGGEYSESDWATYTEYYGDYAYPILVSTCGASPLGERCNVQFLGAQYAKVTVNGYETYATTVTPGSQVSFTIETGDPEITATSVAVGDTALEATDGTYSCTVSADTFVTITLSGTMTAPGDGGDIPEKTGYPISFTVSDGTNPIGDAQITVTGGRGCFLHPGGGHLLAGGGQLHRVRCQGGLPQRHRYSDGDLRHEQGGNQYPFL